MRIIIFLTAILTLHTSQAQYADVPYEPVYASDQPEITFDSLGGEIGQFQQMADLHSMLGNIQTKKLEVENNRKALERGKKLAGSEAISKDELDRREYHYKLSLGQLGEMENRSHMKRISLESTKIGIMMNGDPQLDKRKELAEKMKESLEFQVKALNYGLNNAILTEAHEAKRAADALTLLNKKAISEVEYEQRLQEHEKSKIQRTVYDQQILVINKAIEGLEKSLRLLF